MSIRRTLLVSLLTGLMICTAIITFVAYFNTTHEMHELFSENMKQIATVIKDEAFAKSSSSADVKEPGADEPEESSLIQTWDAQGLLLHSSQQEVDLPLQAAEGFSTPTVSGKKWNVYTLKVPGQGFVQIAQPRKMVTTMVGESAMRTLLPFTILFVVLGIGAWLIVGKSLSSLSHLSKLIANQKIDQLRPFSNAETPNEVQPIVDALNRLLDRLEKAINSQNQFLGDAAHELRTPLTAVKLQAGLLSRAQSTAERDNAMDKLSEGIERSINMASQLLSASRSSAVRASPDFQPVRLHHVIRSSLATFAPLAAMKNIDVTFDPSDECIICGDEESIRTLANNLIDNAVRHTPVNGKVRVSLCKQDGKTVLKIMDSGPGIPEAEKHKIFERFYRIPGTASYGAGLGLSIVKDVANNHGAVVTVANDPKNQGAIFCIVFRSQPAEMAA